MNSDKRIVQWIDQPRGDIGEHSLPLMILAGIVFFLLLVVSCYFIYRYISQAYLPQYLKRREVGQAFETLITCHNFTDDEASLLRKVARKHSGDPTNLMLSVKDFDTSMSAYLLRFTDQEDPERDAKQHRMVLDIRNKLFG